MDVDKEKLETKQEQEKKTEIYTAGGRERETIVLDSSDVIVMLYQGYADL